MLIKNIYARLGASLFRGGLSIVSSIFIVRILGVDVIGKIAYYYGLVGMLTLFSDLGIGMAYRKFLASDRPDSRDAAGYLFLKTVMIILFCLLVLGAFRFYDRISPLDRRLFFIAFFITLLDLISQIFTDSLSGRRDFIVLSRIEVMGSISLFLYNIAVCLFFPNIYLLALNMAIMPVIFITVGGRYCMRHHVFFLEIPERKTFSKYFYYAYPIAFSSVVGRFVGHFEKVLLGRLIGMKELGFYRLALGIFSGFDKVIKPITSTLFTELSYRVNRSAEFMKSRFGDLVHVLGLMGGVMALCLLFGSRPVVEIFYGAENMRTAVILQFFALSIMARLFWRPYRHILYAVEAHHPLAYFSVVEVALRLSSYYLLIPLTVKGVSVGAVAIPLTEFVLWILPSGVYNLCALFKQFGSVHVMSVLFRIWLPLFVIVSVSISLNFSLYLLAPFLALFLGSAYFLRVLNRERWDAVTMPFHRFLCVRGRHDPI